MFGISTKRQKQSNVLVNEREEINNLIETRKQAIGELKKLDSMLQQLCKNGREH